MRKRKVDLKKVIVKTLTYRFFIVFIQAMFTFIYIKNLSKAFQISIVWNVANIVLYFIYEYLFSKKWDTIVKTEGFVLWFTGLPCSGKTTLADSVREELIKRGIRVERLDGDIVRSQGLSDDLKFSKEDRDKNIRRVNFVSKVLSRNNVAVLASFVSPYLKTRKEIRKSVTNFIEVYVMCSSGTCANRDVKGMWKKAITGEIKNFTGWSAPYEEPKRPEILCNTDKETIEESTNKIIDYLKTERYI